MQQYNDKVLIVGAGPVGLTLALSLAKKRIKFRIIDKRAFSSRMPRAINISQNTLKIFEKLGIENQFWEDGIKLDELVVYWNKQPQLNINYKNIDTAYPYFFHLEQYKLEKYLEKSLKKLNCSVERQLTLKDLDKQGNQVNALLEHSDGIIETDNFSYVVGCDGGNSIVRKLENISVEEKKYPSYFMLMDADIHHDADGIKLHYYLNDNGYVILVPLPNGKFRIIISFKGEYPGNNRLDLSKENFQKVLNERNHENIKIKQIIWATSASFSHKIAMRARMGRIFIAGDALHQFSPVGGTNMNMGIQDAYSLADKLGRYDQIDLYETERLSCVRKNLAVTEHATDLLTRTDDSFSSTKNSNDIQDSLKELFMGPSIGSRDNVLEASI